MKFKKGDLIFRQNNPNDIYQFIKVLNKEKMLYGGTRYFVSTIGFYDGILKSFYFYSDDYRDGRGFIKLKEKDILSFLSSNIHKEIYNNKYEELHDSLQDYMKGV